jgi:hypothetical protein
MTPPPPSPVRLCSSEEAVSRRQPRQPPLPSSPLGATQRQQPGWQARKRGWLRWRWEGAKTQLLWRRVRPCGSRGALWRPRLMQQGQPCHWEGVQLPRSRPLEDVRTFAGRRRGRGVERRRGLGWWWRQLLACLGSHLRLRPPEGAAGHNGVRRAQIPAPTGPPLGKDLQGAMPWRRPAFSSMRQLVGKWREWRWAGVETFQPQPRRGRGAREVALGRLGPGQSQSQKPAAGRLAVRGKGAVPWTPPRSSGMRVRPARSTPQRDLGEGACRISTDLLLSPTG